MNKRRLLPLIAIISIAACKKENIGQPVPPAENRQLLLTVLDSVYLYARQLYYWNEQLPDINKFSPRSYANQTGASDLAIVRKELFDLSHYAVNPSTGHPYEQHPERRDLPKYSTVIVPGDPASYHAGELTPIAALKAGSSSYGLSMVAVAPGDIRILMASKGSASGAAGLKRGDRLLAINDRGVATTEDFYRYAAEAMEGSRLRLKVRDGKSGEERPVTLVNIAYAQNPLLREQVFVAGTRVVGYLAYERFTEERNTRTYLESVFSRFAQQGVHTLIVDLRYNGGGFQNTCKYLANMIAPADADGRIMFREYYNNLMQSGQASLLKMQPILDENGTPVMLGGRPATLFDIDYSVAANTTRFEKTGGLLAVNQVYFIVSDQTASASELLINSLRPYLDVKLIGVSLQGSTVKTYGKPIGFFDIYINRYKLYLSLYQTKNAREEGDYFSGMPADISLQDDPRYDFGDIRDPAIYYILHNIAPREYPVVTDNKRILTGFPLKTLDKGIQVQYGLIKQISDLHFK
ncbi:hypothetical protein KTO58_12445 [Chitinophaga pendula]|uniref:S41 family peptidase n=1 Tax=Chitinophaga TaxID=79328 RepID=UPI000BAF88E8|nr:MULTISPECIES: S41 family peptidase [Chitinophaga]ASZ12436.1 hypothetical protein CK934_16445 [Chitinophaga sp. MD30]UCJ09967.1 hypothetical protein KTO58_12445 [Chitinophaga pendula]